MVAPVSASERDLRALAGIISEDRPDIPTKEGLPPSLLTDLMGQIRCDVITFACRDRSYHTPTYRTPVAKARPSVERRMASAAFPSACSHLSNRKSKS